MNIFTRSCNFLRRAPFSRALLSEAFACEKAWEERLATPTLSRVNQEELFYELLKKFQTDGKISPVDFDIFVNKISSEEVLEETESLVNKFRRSPNTAFVLPSSGHAVIRSFLEFNRTDILMKMLNDRLQYGLFLDSYTASLLMDKFIESQNYRDAAKCAINLMLQEDLGCDLSRTLSVYSCWMYLLSPQTEPWEPFPKPPPEEPVDVVKVRVDYLREPFFDDHFDLEDPHHLLGKTLAYANKNRGDFIGVSLTGLGLILYQKYPKALECLELAVQNKVSVSNQVLQMISEKIADKEFSEKAQILDLLVQVEQQSLVSSDDLQKTLLEEIQIAQASLEPKLIAAQKSSYKAWSEEREKAVQEQILAITRLKKLKDIEQKKKALKEKEDQLYFFENEDKWILEVEKNEKLLSDLMAKVPKYEREQMNKTEENYTPPEMPV